MFGSAALEGVKLRLLREKDALVPGAAVTLGLHIEHEKGFHTYWKSPGMVGIPTAVEWVLPAGFKISEPSWPHPEITHMLRYPCHGYERDVTLLFTLTPPPELSASELKLTAKVNWMACSRNCFPGNVDLSLSLPVAAENKTVLESAPFFAKARHELPRTDHAWVSRLASKSDDSVIHLVITPKLAQVDVGEIYFFSSDAQVNSAESQKISWNAGDLILSLPRSEYSPKGCHSLPGVLKYGDHYLSFNPSY